MGCDNFDAEFRWSRKMATDVGKKKYKKIKRREN